MSYSWKIIRLREWQSLGFFQNRIREPSGSSIVIDEISCKALISVEALDTFPSSTSTVEPNDESGMRVLRVFLVQMIYSIMKSSISGSFQRKTASKEVSPYQSDQRHHEHEGSTEVVGRR